MEVIIAKGFDLIVTLVLGLISWFVTDAVKTLRKDIGKNENEIATVKKDLSDLKSDLPVLYVLKDDYIRVMNNVDDKLNRILLGKRGDNQ